MKGFKDIDLRFCHKCGTCAGICPDLCISLNKGLPELVKECLSCGLCYKNCPGRGFNFSEFNKRLFGENLPDADVGYYRSIYISNAADSAVRKQGASGGVVTALLLGLLKRKEISAAVTVRMNIDKPWLAEAAVATLPDDIIKSSQSKYVVMPLSSVFREFADIRGDIAFVGLPCHIHAVRLLEKNNWPHIKKTKYAIGIFCGFNMDYKATDFLINKSGIRRNDIKSLQYRGGDWPGGFCIIAKDGKRFFVEKHIYNYLNLMFIPKRCLVCPDLTNEFADISIGDAWKGNSSHLGYSTVIVRTKKGVDLINNASLSKDIAVRQTDKLHLVRGHSQLILYKKKGVLLRQHLLNIKPAFGLNKIPISLKAKVFNVIFFYIICIMRLPIMIFLFRFIPIKFPGIAGKFARNIINKVAGPKITKEEKIAEGIIS